MRILFPSDAYWCLWCNRLLFPIDIVVDEDGNEMFIYIHDDVPHPVDATYDEDNNPQ